MSDTTVNADANETQNIICLMLCIGNKGVLTKSYSCIQFSVEIIFFWFLVLMKSPNLWTVASVHFIPSKLKHRLKLCASQNCEPYFFKEKFNFHFFSRNLISLIYSNKFVFGNSLKEFPTFFANLRIRSWPFS